MLFATDVKPFFFEAIDEGFRETGLEEKLSGDEGKEAGEAVKAYVVDVLAEFVRRDRQAPTKSIYGKPARLERVLDFWEFLQQSGSASERLWGYEHLGKVCVFTAGIFPESLGTRKNLLSEKDYGQIASSSYAAADTIQRAVSRGSYPVFEIMAEYTDQIIDAMQYARQKRFTIDNWMDRLKSRVQQSRGLEFLQQ